MLAASEGKRGIIRGVGDDTAVLRPGAGRDVLLTGDALVEGRHFRRAWFSGRDLGWRLAAVNLSDIAAMGGDPRWALLSLSVPDDVAGRFVLDIERGARDHLARFGADIVGGNLSGIDKTLVCDMTLAGAVARGRYWRRTCRPGRDAIVLVGRLGDARAGLEVLRSKRSRQSYGSLVRAYKKPEPLIEAARLARGDRAVHGAVDVSDGFVLDLSRICDAAGAGFVVDADALVPSRSLASFCATARKRTLDYMLYGGEDYALVLAVGEWRAASLAAKIHRHTRLPATVVGRFTRTRGRFEIADSRGRRRRLEARGWDHLRRERR
jgi:thiamine-monophosphate kinase